jgi:hypothetical protein
MSTKSFSIENKENPLTKKPFGKKYDGNFVLKRPSFLDRSLIATRVAAEFNSFGPVPLANIPEPLRKAARICHTVYQLCEHTPGWLDREKIITEEDEAAFNSVSEEVDAILEAFRAESKMPG